MRSMIVRAVTWVYILVYVAVSSSAASAVKTSQLIALRPLAVAGTYCLPSGQDLDCVFLGRKDLDVISSEDDEKDEVLICDLVPLLLSRKPFSDKDQYRTSVLAPNPIVNRDAGWYDSLPFAWGSNEERRPQEVKKAIFDKCNTVKGNPGLALVKAAEDILDAEVNGLFIEVVDEYGGGEGGVVLGAGAVVAQQGETSKKYRISQKEGSFIRSLTDLKKLPISKPRVESNKVEDRDKERLLLEEAEASNSGAPLVTTVTCHLDEVVGLSRSLDIPIWVPRGLFQRVCEDVRLTKSPMLLSAPATGRKAASSSTNRRGADEEDIDTVWTVYNPREFISMSAVEKRDLLRASGVRLLPRPREGVQALDAVLMDLMDASVRSEFQRLSSSSAGNSGGGERTDLLRRMGEALENDDVDAATALRAEFAFKTALRADPTQEAGSYDPYLDQDDWYAEARRKAMQPKDKKS